MDFFFDLGRTLVAFLGVFLLLVMAHEVGHFVTAKLSGVKVEEFGFGYPPRLWAFRRGETVYSINLLPLGGFVKMLGEHEHDPAETRSLAGKSIPVRLMVLSSGCAMNFLLAVVVFTGSLVVPTDIVVGGEGVKVAEVASGSPAEAAGVEKGDIIQALAYQSVRSPTDLQRVVVAVAGERAVMTLLRDGERVEVSLTPRKAPPVGEGPLGVRVQYAALYTEKFSLPLWEALPRAFSFTLKIPFLIRDEAMRMFTERTLEGVGGPIGVVQATGEVAQMGLAPLVNWMGALSMTLAIINILPIPMLDGGRILFVLVELLRGGRRISHEREAVVHFIGFLLLMTFIALLTYNDILRLIRGETILR